VKTPSKNVDDVSHIAYPRQDRLADIKKKARKTPRSDYENPQKIVSEDTSTKKNQPPNPYTEASTRIARRIASESPPQQPCPTTIRHFLKDSKTGFSRSCVVSLDKARAVLGAWKIILVIKSRLAQGSIPVCKAFQRKV